MRRFALALASLCLFAPALAAVSDDEAATRAYSCLECHAADGSTASPDYPRLAGQHAGYLLKQLRDFQSGQRRHQVMSRMADGIPDADLAAIARFFGSRSSGVALAAASAGVARGLFEQGDAVRGIPACSDCHGADGRGRADGAPAVAGQQRFYLRGQLFDWKNGVRGNSAGGVMNRVAAGLSIDEIEALAEYLAGR